MDFHSAAPFEQTFDYNNRINKVNKKYPQKSNCTFAEKKDVGIGFPYNLFLSIRALKELGNFQR